MRVPMRSLVVSVLISASAGAANAADAAGTISLLSGRATAVDASGAVRTLRQTDPLYAGEVISTGPASYLNIVFRDSGRILLRPNTRFAIDEFQYHAPAPAAASLPGSSARPADNAFFRLLKGGFRAITGAVGKRDHADYRVRTPVATIGIRGTDYEARLCAGDCLDVDPAPADGLYAGVEEGAIGLTTDAGTTEQAKGQYTFTSFVTGKVEPLARPPKVLTQDPLPSPADCGN